jgi:hypothetical protein
MFLERYGLHGAQQIKPVARQVRKYLYHHHANIFILSGQTRPLEGRFGRDVRLLFVFRVSPEGLAGRTCQTDSAALCSWGAFFCGK